MANEKKKTETKVLSIKKRNIKNKYFQKHKTNILLLLKVFFQL